MAEKRGPSSHQTSKTTEMPVLPLALCRDEDPKLFISDDGDLYNVHFNPRAAQEICWRCPEREPCLEYAVANPTLSGVWGGTTPAGRVAIRIERAES